jgi:hypothetical protein
MSVLPLEEEGRREAGASGSSSGDGTPAGVTGRDEDLVTGTAGDSFASSGLRAACVFLVSLTGGGIGVVDCLAECAGSGTGVSAAGLSGTIVVMVE